MSAPIADPLPWMAELPNALCSSRGKQNIRRLVERLPACSEDVGLECDLARPGRLHAVGMAVTRSASVTRSLLPGGSNPRLQRLALHSPAWRRLSAFVLLWLERNTTMLQERVPFVFLEFDRAPHWEMSPCVFLAVDWPLAELEPAFRRQAPFSVPGFQLILQLVSFLGRRATAEEAHQLARCWRELPDGGAWAHVGILTSRPNVGHRMSLLVPAPAIGAYLERVAPKAKAAPIVALIDRYAPVAHFGFGAQRVQLDIDVAAEVSPRLGFTLLPPGPAGWPALLAALVHDGLCHERCATAAKQWNGGTICVGAPTRSLFHTYLSHVKVVVPSEQPATAKLYVGVRTRDSL